MFKVEAIIQPFRLREVQDALVDIGVEAITITDVRGHGRQRGHSEMYRGQEYDVAFVPKIKVEVISAAADTERIVAAILRGARTGRIGDGKIFISPVGEAVRIRNGQINEAAL